MENVMGRQYINPCCLKLEGSASVLYFQEKGPVMLYNIATAMDGA